MKPNERIAHDLICIIKYGSIGGSVNANEISRLVDHMERTGLVQREAPAVTMPTMSIKMAAPSVLPTIRLP